MVQGVPEHAHERLVSRFSMDVTEEGYALGYVLRHCPARAPRKPRWSIANEPPDPSADGRPYFAYGLVPEQYRLRSEERLSHALDRTGRSRAARDADRTCPGWRRRSRYATPCSNSGWRAMASRRPCAASALAPTPVPLHRRSAQAPGQGQGRGAARRHHRHGPRHAAARHHARVLRRRRKSQRRRCDAGRGARRPASYAHRAAGVAATLSFRHPPARARTKPSSSSSSARRLQLASRNPTMLSIRAMFSTDAMRDLADRRGPVCRDAALRGRAGPGPGRVRPDPPAAAQCIAQACARPEAFDWTAISADARKAGTAAIPATRRSKQEVARLAPEHRRFRALRLDQPGRVRNRAGAAGAGSAAAYPCADAGPGDALARLVHRIAARPCWRAP